MLNIDSEQNLICERFESTINPESTVDERCDFVFKSPTNAQLRSSIVDNYPQEAKLTAGDTHILIHGKWWNPKKIEITAPTHSQIVDETNNLGSGFQYEFIHFAECIEKKLGESPYLTHMKSEMALNILTSALFLKT